MKQETVEQRGFVLVGTVVFLAILTLIGAVALFKASIEMSVSASAVQGEQAFAAANAGLAENYAYWTYNAAGQAERQAITDAMSVASAHYDAGRTPASMDDLIGIAGDQDGDGDEDMVDVDIYVRASAMRVFDVAPGGMTPVATNTWATVNGPQVALWAASFEKAMAAEDYPYAVPNVADCSDCSIVVYALGRAGPPPAGGPIRDARRLLREIQVTTEEQLRGVSALTNSPEYGNWSQLCGEADPKTNLGSTTAWNPSYDNTVIEVTQAPYVRSPSSDDSRPSGIAIKSNTNLGSGAKLIRSQFSSSTGAVFQQAPLLVYSGHGASAPANQARANDASATPDNTVTYDNLDLLASDVLPHNLAMAPVMNSTAEMNYFANANTQLFDLDAYRWAAEEFTCQDPSQPDGTNGNGRYCSKAEALRLAVGSAAPVTGRLTVAEFEYNINYGFPMFGIIRVMMPTEASGTTFSCTVGGAAFNSQYYEVSPAVARLRTDAAGGTGFYDGSPTTIDSDMVLDGTARILVYGSLFFDFFIDEGDPAVENGCVTTGGKKGTTVCTTDLLENYVFDPAAPGGGERLLLPLEAVDSYMMIEFPILINPSMPRGPLGSFPTAAASGTIDAGVSTNPIDLAAPTGGYFPASEGMVLATDSGTYLKGLAGLMQLMSNGNSYPSITMPADGLVSISEALAASPGTFPPSGANGLFTDALHNPRLEYYYDLMVANAKQSDPFAWPIAPFPISMSDSFYIGMEDAAAGNNQGDMLHLLFPSGYAHGWKVALAALDMKAADWNTMLTGLESGLAAQHTVHKNYGDADMPKGSPFNTVLDAGYGQVARLEANQDRFFHVDATHSSGYGLINSDWADIPAEMYVGGLLDMHAHANINGVVYTPGPLEWEPGVASYGGNRDHLAYINGAIITGFGAYVRNRVTAMYVLVYNGDALDNLNTLKSTPSPMRMAWQALN